MRTRAKGNVLDAVSYPMGGVTMGGSIAVVGGINTGVGPGNNDALIVDGNQDYLFTTGRTFDVVGGPNAGPYVVLAPGAQYNNLVNAPHIVNTTEIPVASVTSTSAGGTIAGYGIDLDGTIITNSAEPIAATDVATKNYVDTTPASSLAPGSYAIDISGTAANANLLDSLDSTAFFKIAASNTTSGNITISHNGNPHLIINDTGTLGNPYIQFLTQGGTGVGSEAGALIQNINSTSDGYLLLHKYTSGSGTAAQIKLLESGRIVIDPSSGTSTATQNLGNFYVNGAIVATGNITAFSDVRLKEDIKPIDNAMDKIVQIGGYTFTRSDLDDDKRYAGVIAQEVQHVLPEVIEKDEEGMLSVAYGNLVALLIEGMKEQKKEIDDLKKRLDKVEE